MEYRLIDGKIGVYGLKDFVGKPYWDLLRRTGKIKILAPHGRGVSATVAYNSLSDDMKVKIAEEIGHASEFTGVTGRFIDTVTKDLEAFSFYSSESGLTASVIDKLTNTASILNAATELELKHKQMHRKKTEYIRTIIASKMMLCEMFPNRLAWSEKRLKATHVKYKESGYESLIHSNRGNQNRRKVTAQMEDLIIAIKSLPQKPYDKTVLKIYSNWHAGEFELVDQKTGEMFDRNDFSKNGKAIEIAVKTVRKYTTSTRNEKIVDANNMTFHDYNNEQRPHVHRDNKLFSNSLISLDDRDLRKSKQGIRPKAYYAFDRASECIIGYSHSRKKDAELFEDCILNMMQFVYLNQLGMPAEIQVENHIVSEYFDVLGQMFPFMRVCAPTNSREKHAERLIGKLKYEVEKENRVSMGRWNLRRKENRVNTERINDEDIEKEFDYDVIVADNIADIEQFNDALHPNQKDFKGQSRKEVYLSNQNPNLKPYEPHIAAHYFGKFAPKPVKIYSNQYVKVANSKFQFSKPEYVERFKDGKAYANWIPNPDGSVTEVYLFANTDGTVQSIRNRLKEVFICKCDEIALFKDAQIERTDKDVEIMNEQHSYIAKFDKQVKDRTEHMPKIIIDKPMTKEHQSIINKTVFVNNEELENHFENDAPVVDDDFIEDDFDFGDFSPEAMKQRAILNS